MQSPVYLLVYEVGTSPHSYCHLHFKSFPHVEPLRKKRMVPHQRSLHDVNNLQLNVPIDDGDIHCLS